MKEWTKMKKEQRKGSQNICAGHVISMRYPQLHMIPCTPSWALRGVSHYQPISKDWTWMKAEAGRPFVNKSSSWWCDSIFSRWTWGECTFGTSGDCVVFETGSHVLGFQTSKGEGTNIILGDCNVHISNLGNVYTNRRTKLMEQVHQQNEVFAWSAESNILSLHSRKGNLCLKFRFPQNWAIKQINEIVGVTACTMGVLRIFVTVHARKSASG